MKKFTPYVSVFVNKSAAKRKLTIEQAHEIKNRLDRGDSKAAIARDYGVKTPVIYGIADGRSYRDA